VRGFFNQPVFDAAIPPSFRKGEVEILLAQQRLNMAVVEQIHATRIAFYTALLNNALRELGEAQHQRLSENVKTQQDRYEAGQTDRGSISSAKVLEQELDPRIEEVRRQYEAAVLALASAMGQDVGPKARLPQPEGKLTFAPIHHDLDAQITFALKHRPDLELGRLLLRAAEQDQKIIEAAYYPVLEGTFAGTYIPTTIHRASGGSVTRTDDIISSQAIPGLASTWRVIDNGRVGGQVVRADAIRQMNKISLQNLESNVSIELKRISNNLSAIEKRWNSLNAAVANAEGNVVTIQQSLTEGLSSQLEFRTAESSFLETKGALLSTAYQQNVALAEWDRATGRYFQFSGDRASISH
jgi:outer membrane protein TolC